MLVSLVRTGLKAHTHAWCGVWICVRSKRPLHRRFGSWSTGVFQARTATGSELFSLLTCPHTTALILLIIFSPLEISSIKIGKAIRSWKCSLAVDGLASQKRACFWASWRQLDAILSRESYIKFQTCSKTLRYRGDKSHWKSHVHVHVHVRFWSCNFSGRSCWCNFQRAAHKDCKRQTWRWYSDYFICPMPALSVLYFVIERSVLMALVFYYKDILDVKNPVILRMFFVTERTPLTTCSACVAKSKNCHWMQDSSLGNTPISENHSLEFHEIWHENT